MGRYKVILWLKYDKDVYLSVVIADNIFCKEKSFAEKIAKTTTVYVHYNRLHICNEIIGDFDIGIEEVSRYSFESYFEILLPNENKYVPIWPNDYTNLGWDISTAYKKLKGNYPSENVYKFLTIDYAVVEITKSFNDVKQELLSLYDKSEYIYNGIVPHIEDMKNIKEINMVKRSIEKGEYTRESIRRYIDESQEDDFIDISLSGLLRLILSAKENK